MITYIKYLMMFFYKLGFTDFQFLIFHLFQTVSSCRQKVQYINILPTYVRTFNQLPFVSNKENKFSAHNCCQYLHQEVIHATQAKLYVRAVDIILPYIPHFFARILCTHRDHHLSAKGVLLGVFKVI